MKNYSEYIKSVQNRTLTAKGYKFLNQCVLIVANNRGLNIYSKELKDTKERLSKIVHHLFIDKGFDKETIIGIIKDRTISKGI